MKIVAIIQARMGSKRFPEKVLMRVKGKPLLWYQIERLKKIKKISRIVIATSILPQNDKIEIFCKKNGIDCFKGNEDDVLDRYYRCALAYGADIIVRITGDCPLIDPNITDEVIRFYLKNTSFDLVRTGPRYPEGFDVEVLPLKSLELAWKEARLKSEREHITSFLWKNDKRFKIKTLFLERDYSFLRLTVDEVIDFEVIKTVIKELYSRKGVSFSFKDILELYKEKPYIFEKNKNIIRNEGYLKSLKEDCIIR